jgi:hypothetical protein
VATLFNANEYAVTQSFLAAHGISVVAKPVHLINNCPHWATALGGVPVLVAASQAEDAVRLLFAIGNDGRDHKTSLRRRLGYVFVFGFFIGFGIVAPPSSGLVIHSNRTELAHNIQAD